MKNIYYIWCSEDNKQNWYICYSSYDYEMCIDVFDTLSAKHTNYYYLLTEVLH